MVAVMKSSSVFNALWQFNDRVCFASTADSQSYPKVIRAVCCVERLPVSREIAERRSGVHFAETGGHDDSSTFDPRPGDDGKIVRGPQLLARTIASGNLKAQVGLVEHQPWTIALFMESDELIPYRATNQNDASRIGIR
jgi:hypothetical protein